VQLVGRGVEERERFRGRASHVGSRGCFLSRASYRGRQAEMKNDRRRRRGAARILYNKGD
jgi:hypothetical protein